MPQADSPANSRTARLVGPLTLALVMAACLSEPEPSTPNVAPTASITAPTSATLFAGGDSVTYSGSATDAEDGPEPGSRLAWWVMLHHDTHTHPFMPRTTGPTGVLYVPPIGETSDNVFLRVYLEATDDSGSADTVSVDVLPRKVQFTLATTPAGLTVTLDGQPQVTPVTITGVVGMERELGVTTPQSLGGTAWHFASWSDGGAETHRIATPETATTYTARFAGTANPPPTVTLTAPASGVVLVTGVATTLTATAADPNGTVARVEFFDGSTRLGEDVSAPWSLSWTPTTAGTHSLTARATDDLGSVGNSAAVSVTVTLSPNVNPTATLTAPVNGATVIAGTATTLAATAADADGTIARVGFYDGATLISEDASAPYAASWTPSVTGTHSLTARATDNRGGTGTSAAVNVTVNPASGADTQAPTLTLTSPTAQQTGIVGSPIFTVSASDNVAVTAVDYQLDGDALATATAAPWSFTLPATSAYTTGVHVVRARARDAAGNQSAWSAARVTFGGDVNVPAGYTRTTYAARLGSTGTAMAWSPDGRLFICQQDGAVRVVKNGVLLSTPFVTVPTSADGERGLLGIAFHPQFASNGYVYLYYTTTSGGVHNRVSRFTASGDVAVGGSELPIVNLPGLSAATNHNGGALHFGPDGRLYVAVGENATASNAPLLTTVFGKMLRFNADGTIPMDNPFVGSTTGLNQAIWARGLRNPFTFAFDPATGLMYINDVGQNTWEEINVGQAGANYGWPSTEGATTASGITSPLYTYGHNSNSTLVVGNAIAGASFYRPSTMMFPAAWAGDFFFGDYVYGWVNRLDPGNGNAVYAFARVGNYLSDVQVGPDGALYVLAVADGGQWGVLRYSRP